jgi:hypothetical protein
LWSCANFNQDNDTQHIQPHCSHRRRLEPTFIFPSPSELIATGTSLLSSDDLVDVRILQLEYTTTELANTHSQTTITLWFGALGLILKKSLQRGMIIAQIFCL